MLKFDEPTILFRLDFSVINTMSWVGTNLCYLSDILNGRYETEVTNEQGNAATGFCLRYKISPYRLIAKTIREYA